MPTQIELTDPIDQARDWLNENPGYTISIYLTCKNAGYSSVRGCFEGEQIALSTGYSIDKHVRKVCEKLIQHARQSVR